MFAKRPLVVGVLLAVTAGCYRYSVVEGPVPVASQVEALLSTEGQVALRQRAGLDVRELKGELIESNDDHYLIAVQSTSAFSEFGGVPLEQRIDIPKRDVLAMRVREVDPVRLVALLGIGAVAGALVISRGFGERNPGQVVPPDGGPDDRRSGLRFSIPLRIP